MLCFGLRSGTLLLLGMLAMALPSQLFLTEDELSAARGGFHRTGIATHSERTFITPEVDGEDAMGALFYDLEGVKAGDEVMLETYHSDGSVFLLPHSHADHERSQLFDVMRRMALNNVTLRVLINWNIFDPISALSFCRRVNGFCKEVRRDFDCCMPESRHHAFGGSLHNKMWIVRRTSNTVVYNGGMDIAKGFWDTRSHDMSEDRQREELGSVAKYWGWHDVLYRVQGDAVRDYVMHFSQRWNAGRSLFSVFFNIKPYPVNLKELVIAPDVPVTQSAVQTQLLRTLACKDANEHYGPYAPDGEHTMFAGFRKLVRSCRKTLVLEDQFAFFDEAFEVVGGALEDLEHLVIITNSASSYKTRMGPVSMDLAANTRTYFQHQAWQTMLDKAEKKDAAVRKKVHAFSLSRPNASRVDADQQIYLHTKNYYCDDRFALIGSAGLERTAMTNDIDVGMLVADQGDVAGPTSFVGKLRRTLWAEYLGLGSPDDPLLFDVGASIREMERQAEAQTGMLRKYWPEVIEGSFWQLQFYQLLEPEGRCGIAEPICLVVLPILLTVVACSYCCCQSPKHRKSGVGCHRCTAAWHRGVMRIGQGRRTLLHKASTGQDVSEHGPAPLEIGSSWEFADL